jgi:co-chaperonin GroES (HSP10)
METSGVKPAYDAPLKCSPGIVAVAMYEAPEASAGGILIPERSRHTYYEEDDPIAGFEPSVAVVIGSGVDELQPGTTVLVRDGDGLELDGAKFGDWEAKTRVRMYGITVPDGMPDGYVEDLPWEESILATYEGCEIRPTGYNVLLERDDAPESIGGILLPDSARDGASEATVVAVGELVTGCKPGDTVVYHPLAQLDFTNPENKNHRMIREKAIFTVVEKV